jgi:transcriptional regulator with XRE-family HTH domain
VEAEQSRPLRDMVKAEKARGTSYREMEKRARRHGHNISHSQLADYAAGVVQRAPHAAMITALAAALNTSLAAVHEAVLMEWYGYTPRALDTSPTRVSAVVPATLSPEKEAELIRLVSAWVHAQEG